MSFSKSRAGVGIGLLAVLLLAVSRGYAANFDAIELELPAQSTASVVDFSLNLPVTGSAVLFYMDQESPRDMEGRGVYPTDADAGASVKWEILWQQPALIPVSAVPEPSVGTTMLLGVLLLRRLLRRRERNVGGAA